MARKVPRDPKEIFQEFTSDYRAVFGDELVSIVLYGSGASPHYRHGKSDLNFMIVLGEKGIEALDRAFQAVKKWQKRGVAIPLILTEEYLDTSLDVYPIEYLNFRKHYIVVYGKDVLEGLRFDRGRLRLQCEREIKGKLLLLRHTFLGSGGSERVLRQAVIRSIPAFTAIFEALLYLKEETAPQERRERVRAVCKAFELDGGVFERLLDIREEKIRPPQDEMNRLFKDYLKAVRKLAELVDRMDG